MSIMRPRNEGMGIEEVEEFYPVEEGEVKPNVAVDPEPRYVGRDEQ